MQQHRKRGNIVILLLILVVVLIGALLYLYKSGNLDNLLMKGQTAEPSGVTQVSKDDGLTKGDEVEDIEKDLNTTNLSETDKVLGEVDITLENQ